MFFLLKNNIIYNYKDVPWVVNAHPAMLVSSWVSLNRNVKPLEVKKILLWKRYIDDIVLIWKGSKTELEQYMEEINSIHGITHECSENFLDTTIYKGSRYIEQGILDIQTHIKKTNKQLYVHM